MKKNILIIISLITFSFSFAQTTFQKNYGGGGSSVCQTNDGGFAFTGAYENGIGVPPYTDILIVKTNSIGDTVWTRTLGGQSFDKGNYIEQTSDGGYIITGYYDTDICLIKLDSTGNNTWIKTYGGAFVDQGNCVRQTIDGGYICVGYTASFGAGSYDIYLIKTNSIGDTLWTKTFGGNNNDRGRSVCQTSDGGYFITGFTWSFGSGGPNVYAIKTDASGNLVWNKTFGAEEGYFGQQTTDGGYIITGTRYVAPELNLYLIKTDGNGNLLWSKHFDGPGQWDEYGVYVQQTNDGGYIITGETRSFGSGGKDIYLVKTDSIGSLTWSRTYGQGGDETGYFVKQTNDGGYIILGQGGPNPAIYVIKTDSNGNSGCFQTTPATIVAALISSTTIPAPLVSFGGTITVPSITAGYDSLVVTLCIITDYEILENEKKFLIFPNPVTDELTIENAELRIESVDIYDLMGEKIYFEKPVTSNQKPVTVGVSKLNSGIYFVTVTDENGDKTTKKFVKM